MLAPVTLNIVLFHAFLNPAGMYLQVLMAILHMFLGYKNWNAYKPMFAKK
jgi:hypothetical protein